MTTSPHSPTPVSPRQILRGGRLLNPGDTAFAAVDILISDGIVEAHRSMDSNKAGGKIVVLT